MGKKKLKLIIFSCYKAQKNAKIGSIETVKWIIEGDDTDKTESIIYYYIK